ncbi:hypothetical protein Y032_0101g3408 [Ancylostoma ceylanicum]|uniref:Uncharacterized protein n=1 Tax=Ancylostoma ceylanicum TaxID=53326 RepID=A0A016TI52_9BILA|nr:hypothetical protein Y032_0101g3408 [Ancylostoma ceylanicum]
MIDQSFRSILAQGQKYDCTLEVAARDRAQSCATNEIQGGLENKYMVAVSRVQDRVEAMAKGVKEWWKQVRKDKPLGMAVTFKNHHQYLPIRSFTRVRDILTLLLCYSRSIAVLVVTMVMTNTYLGRPVSTVFATITGRKSIRTKTNVAPTATEDATLLDERWKSGMCQASMR